jgi:hypothetical protein
MNTTDTKLDEVKNEAASLATPTILADSDDDWELPAACPLRNGDGECEACQ